MAKIAPFGKYNAAAQAAQKDPMQGVVLFEELVKDYPSDSRVLHGLGISYLNVGDYHQAVPTLEAAAKREREYVNDVQMALGKAYSGLGMPAHAYRALSRAGIVTETWQEYLSVGLPQGAKLADLLDFEDARRYLLTGGKERLAAQRKMEAFSRKFPTYTPALNVMATSLFAQGEFAQAREVIDRTLEHDPRNVHALLNLARLERLAGGVEAVEALRPRVEAARVDDEDGIHVEGGELALASLYALMNDAAQTQAALDRWEATQDDGDSDDEEDDEQDDLYDRHPEAAQLRDRLDALEDHPDAPVMLPSQVLPPLWFERWRAAPPNRAAELIRRDLESIPGWLPGIEEALLHEHREMASALSAFLLDPQYRERPLPDGVSNDERLARLLALLQRPDLTPLPGRMGVARALQVLELLPDGFKLLDQNGQELKTLSLKLRTGRSPSPLDKASQRDFERAFALMNRGKFREAVALMEPIVQRYPDFPSAVFNLAAAEEKSGDLALEARAQERIEGLRASHPAYLYASGHLALKAIHAGELDRARELLALPEGVQELHVEEYGYFMAVNAVLALHERRMEQVMETTEALRELVGEDSMPYALLMSEMQAMLKDLVPGGLRPDSP